MRIAHITVMIATSEEQNIKSLWTGLQVAEKQNEKRGLQFGQAMYEYREKHSAQGQRSDLVSSETKSETFEEFCDRMGIPRATAYRWIARYKEAGKYSPFNSPSPTEPAPDVATEVAPRTIQERDRDALISLGRRLDSLTKAVLQILDKPDKWLQHAEIGGVSSSALTLMAVLDQLESAITESEAEEESGLPRAVSNLDSVVDALKADGHVFQTVGEA